MADHANNLIRATLIRTAFDMAERGMDNWQPTTTDAWNSEIGGNEFNYQLAENDARGLPVSLDQRLVSEGDGVVTSKGLIFTSYVPVKNRDGKERFEKVGLVDRDGNGFDEGDWFINTNGQVFDVAELGGDLVLTKPLNDEYKMAVPDARLSLLSQSYESFLERHMPHLYEAEVSGHAMSWYDFNGDQVMGNGDALAVDGVYYDINSDQDECGDVEVALSPEHSLTELPEDPYTLIHAGHIEPGFSEMCFELEG